MASALALQREVEVVHVDEHAVAFGQEAEESVPILLPHVPDHGGILAELVCAVQEVRALGDANVAPLALFDRVGVLASHDPTRFRWCCVVDCAGSADLGLKPLLHCMDEWALRVFRDLGTDRVTGLQCPLIHD